MNRIQIVKQQTCEPVTVRGAIGYVSLVQGEQTVFIDGPCLAQLIDAIQNVGNLPGGWIIYNWDIVDSRPKQSGDYWVCRKDGKTHKERWNGSGWAYNGNVIVAYREIPEMPQDFLQT